MNYLLDTNILTRLAEPGHAMHQTALDAVKLVARQGHKLFHIVPQNLYEFWVVCTRPINVNGLGKTAAETIVELANLKALFVCLHDTPAICGVWLCGEMSLVGPRPLQPGDSDKLLALDPKAHAQRLQVRPGLTGPCQVVGRSELDDQRMVELEIDYMENWSLGRDLRVIVKSIFVIPTRVE